MRFRYLDPYPECGLWVMVNKNGPLHDMSERLTRESVTGLYVLLQPVVRNGAVNWSAAGIWLEHLFYPAVREESDRVLS
jgi:hypothetical protein